MNRNVESHFADLPQVELQRSMFDRSFSHQTSFNVGQLIPFAWDEVLPGDTFNVTTSAVVRLQTLLNPIFSNCYLDTYWFFIPNRLTWSHWKEFMGENTESAWLPSTEYTVPYVKYPSGGWNVGTIADYLGVPTGIQPDDAPGVSPQALLFRAYALVCDEWFRDQNVMDPLLIHTGDSAITGSNGSDYVTDVEKGGQPFIVSKYHDYFTSCLPFVQKGGSVTLRLYEDQSPDDLNYGYFPVGTASKHDPVYLTGSGDSAHALPIEMRASSFYKATNTYGDGYDYDFRNSSGDYVSNAGTYVAPTNLWAYMGNSQLTVNDLRLAFQLQKFYEKNARAGTRYREVLREHFGVISPDARMMIPEYLGGHRFPLQIHQVTNTAQGESDFLGDLGAMSNTADVHDDFVKSFTEHGFILGVCCVRYDHSYPQGMNKMLTRNTKLDYYWPVFANIGEQPVYLKEIYLPDASDEPTLDPNSVFGYQEAYAEYRYMPDRVSSLMRPQASGTLASWHLADDYSTAPSLSASWMIEDKTNVDRVLAVTSSVSNQVFADFYVKNIATRCMPVYSIPGLVDHH